MDQFSRTEKIIGTDNLLKLKNLNVLVVGIGGVGGSALEMLVRSGIGNITVIDFDVFEESNLNRQILSSYDVIGEFKTDVALKRTNLISRNCNITNINSKLDENNIDNLLSSNIDYIIDACDDLKAKVLLVKYAIENNIKIISCCGTGNRLNPEKLKITNIWKTEYDPLAKRLRQELRKEKISYKLPVVCSLEKPIKTTGFVGSMAMVPNSAGILLASYVINDIIKDD